MFENAVCDYQCCLIVGVYLLDVHANTLLISECQFGFCTTIPAGHISFLVIWLTRIMWFYIEDK